MGNSAGLTNEVAELAGFWLAEGDHKSNREITITNNAFELIQFSHAVLRGLFKTGNFRVYAYLDSEGAESQVLDGAIMRYYIDRRATKPYYILRFASTKNLAEWKRIVAATCSQEQFYDSILRGFFAGEGNIKTGAHFNRTLRMAQKHRLEVIDRILHHFGIEYKFSINDRSYEIVGRPNWAKLAEIKIADMHPIKKKEFWRVYSSFKEHHHKKNYIRDNILCHLDQPKTCGQLAATFGRGKSRVSSILSDLKRLGKVYDYRVGSTYFWVRNGTNIIPISKRKKTILDLLEEPKRVFQIANSLGVDEKSVSRRLTELSRLGLVSRKDYYWHKHEPIAEVRVCE